MPFLPRRLLVLGFFTFPARRTWITTFVDALHGLRNRFDAPKAAASSNQSVSLFRGFAVVPVPRARPMAARARSGAYLAILYEILSIIFSNRDPIAPEAELSVP